MNPAKKDMPWTKRPRNVKPDPAYPMPEGQGSRRRKYPVSLPLPIPYPENTVDALEAWRALRQLKRAGFRVGPPLLVYFLLAAGKATIYQLWWEMHGIRTRTPTYNEIRVLYSTLNGLLRDGWIEYDTGNGRCSVPTKTGTCKPKNGVQIKQYFYPTEKAQALLDPAPDTVTTKPQ